jgi:murein DD-endopeptidase MepM/ murein hydrolase activator NlpD
MDDKKVSVSLRELLKSNLHLFDPVIEIDEKKPGLVAMDFSISNTDLTSELIRDIDKFCDYIVQFIANKGGRIGVGGYGEHRSIYGYSQVFDPSSDSEEPRRLHLGVDIWAPAGTEVHCPYPGRVHSFSDLDRRGDYGGVIILEHELCGIVFYTLYGHLSRASLNKSVGEELGKGQTFATLGPPLENGFWPPHLHFQIIADLGGYKGDYPGVCRYSEREKYMENCPDPELILKFEVHLTRCN